MAFLDYSGLSHFLDKIKTIFIQTTSKGVNNGVAELNSSGKVPTTQLPEVSTTAAGIMSATDKTKLDGIATGATANAGTITGIKMNGASKGTSGVVDLGTVITSHQDISGKASTADAIKSITRSGTTFTATKCNNTTFTFSQQDNNTTYSTATTSANGLMSSADKTKLDGIAAGANRVFRGKSTSVSVGNYCVCYLFEKYDGQLHDGDIYEIQITYPAFWNADAKSGLKFCNVYNGSHLILSGSDMLNPSDNLTVYYLSGDACSTLANLSGDRNEGDYYIFKVIGGKLCYCDVYGYTQREWMLSTTVNNAIKSITRSGTTFTATRCDDTTFSFDQQDNNTTYSLSSLGGAAASQAIKNITRSGLKFTITRCDNTTFTFNQQDNNTTYSLSTLGAAAASEAIKTISRSGTTFTATRCNNTTFTFSQQDNNTTYSLSSLGAQAAFKWGNVTATTSASGNITLSSTLGRRPILYCYSPTGGICIPYCESGKNVLWCHIVHDDATMTPYANVSKQVYYAYFE